MQNRKTERELRELLRQIDHRGYPAYKETRGVYDFEGYVLSIDHVQGDPFAAPSKVSVWVSGREAGFPKKLYDTKEKRIALQDELLRQFGREVERHSFQAKGSGKSGLLSVSRCGQEILDRSACQIGEDGSVTVRFEAGFPANGRSINARELEKMLFDILPECVKKTLYYRAFNGMALQKIADLAEDQCFIREELKRLELAAFVANGAVLPRESGVSQRPLKGAVPFVSPADLEVTLKLPHYGQLKGMGIARGVTVIVGGGYHGKSTLLKALEAGVYPHRAGDGREYVITEETAVKLRAEDGRSIRQVDISLFINDLPNGKNTLFFETEDASGSTSQAANLAEAIEAGAETFLIDEDTSATNFMIRDDLMKQVVHKSAEPITPFVDRVRFLYEKLGISTILVAGSSGAFFSQADTIIQMDHYRPVHITAAAKKTAEEYEAWIGRQRKTSGEQEKSSVSVWKGEGNSRCPLGKKFDDRVKIRTSGCDTISINKEDIDVRYVEQLADREQLVTLGYLLYQALSQCFDGRKTISQAVEELYAGLEKNGYGQTCRGYVPSGLAMPRRQELYAVLNRYRGLSFPSSQLSKKR